MIRSCMIQQVVNRESLTMEFALNSVKIDGPPVTNIYCRLVPYLLIILLIVMLFFWSIFKCSICSHPQNALQIKMTKHWICSLFFQVKCNQNISCWCGHSFKYTSCYGFLSLTAWAASHIFFFSIPLSQTNFTFAQSDVLGDTGLTQRKQRRRHNAAPTAHISTTGRLTVINNA